MFVNQKPSMKPTKKPLFKRPLLATAIGIAGLLCMAASCQSFINTTQKTEYALAQAADAGMKSWATYYKAVTNNPAAFNRTLAGIENDHVQVNALSIKVAAGLKTLDTLTANAQTNSAVQPAVTAALNSIAADVPALLTFIGTITSTTNVPVLP